MSARSALNVSLTPELTDYIAATVASGRYRSASEVVREALRQFEASESGGMTDAGRGFLLRFADRVGRIRDPVRIMAEAAFLLGSHMEADRAGYAAVSEDGEHVTIEADWVAGETQSLAGRQLLEHCGAPYPATLRKGQTVRCADVLREAANRSDGERQAKLAASGIRASVSVPLVKDGRLCAILFVHQRTPRDWSDADERLLREIAERTWAAVERARAEQALALSEARFRALADAMPQMIFASDADGNNIYCNARMLAFAGVPQKLARSDWAELLHPEDRAASVALRRQSLMTGQDFEREHRLRRFDGIYRWVLVRAVAVRDRSGQIENWYGTCTDITEIVEARQVLKQSNEELELLVAERTRALEDAAHELANEMRRREEMQASILHTQKLDAVGQLTSGVVHDFNNILMAISGSYNLIRTRSDSETMLRIVEHGEKAVERASRLIGQLMSFIRREKLVPKILKLETFLPEAEDLICHAIGSRVTCRFEIAADVWPVLSDPFQLEVALLNLAVNARDAMDRAGEIVIRARNLAAGERPASLAPGDYVSIAVTDRGKGMPPEVIARAAEEFFTTKPQGEGTGLGLPMVHGFAAQLRGTLRIRSAPGQGTTVEIILPRATVNQAEAGAGGGASADPSLHGDATILLVDDDEDLRDIAATYLRDLGYTVLACNSTESATALVRTLRRLDLLITDVFMAGASGAVLAMRLRADWPGLPLLFITGADHGPELADETVLRKPFDLAALGSAVLERLGRWTPPGEGGDKLLARLRTEAVRQFYLNWKSARAGSMALPRLAGVDPMHFGLGPHAFTVAVDRTEPLALRYVSLGSALAKRLGRGLAEMPVDGADQDEDVVGQLASAYRRCTRTGSPVYQTARLDFGDGKPLHLERLVLPVSEGGEFVSHLVGIVMFSEPGGAAA
jgi:PAS domain S-box-containing protein